MQGALRLLLLGMACLAVGARANGQKLSSELKAEGASALAIAARAQGDAVRGAILFPQRRLDCTRCHVRDSANPLGPDLTRLAANVTDQRLVEALLEPSKEITAGFDSVLVLTESDQVITGRVIGETSQQLLLSDSSSGKSLTIAKSNIAQIKPSQQSAMPRGPGRSARQPTAVSGSGALCDGDCWK